MSDLINTRLGQYQLVEVIRRSGTSTIYKAYQESLDRFVTVQVLFHTQDPQVVARFQSEAHALTHLQHPHILPLYDSGVQDGLLYFILQYIEQGTTLGDLLGSPLEPVRALELMTQVLAALDYAHQRGIVHQDIKPGNILMPTSSWPLVANFGIAKWLTEPANQNVPGQNWIVGTPAYLAPEQALGQPVDGRTDLYSTGVVLYELLTGRVPFAAGTPTGMLTKHVYDPPPPPTTFNPALPPAVDTVVLRALEKKAANRYQTAAEMAAMLKQVIGQLEQTRAQSRSTGLAQAAGGHEDLESQYAAGVQAFAAGHWDQAVQWLRQVMTIDPAYADAAAMLEAVEEAQAQTAAARKRDVPPAIPIAAAPQAQAPATLTEGQAPSPPAADPAVVANLAPQSVEGGGRLATAASEQPVAGVPAPKSGSPAEAGGPDSRSVTKRRSLMPAIATGLVVLLLALAVVFAVSLLAGGTGAKGSVAAGGTGGNAIPGATSPTTVPGAGIASTLAPPTRSSTTAALTSTLVTRTPVTSTLRILPTTSQGSVGAVHFGDGQQVVDLLVVTATLATAPAPPAGKTWFAWMVNSVTGALLNLGRVTPDARGAWTLTFNDPGQANLLGLYDRFLITSETLATTPGAPSSDIVLLGQLPRQALVHIRYLLVSFPNTPNKIGLEVGLRTQVAELVRHAQQLNTAQATGNLSNLKLEAEQIVNLIEGTKGVNFGDLNQDGQISNAGDGFGLLASGTQLGYLQGVRDYAQLAAADPDSTADVKLHAGGVLITMDNVQGWVTTVRDQALAITKATNPSTTGPLVVNILNLATEAYEGIPTGTAGNVLPVRDSGGAIISYKEALLMGAIPLQAVK